MGQFDLEEQRVLGVTSQTPGRGFVVVTRLALIAVMLQRPRRVVHAIQVTARGGSASRHLHLNSISRPDRRGVSYPGQASHCSPGVALWAFRLRAGRDSERRVQPRSGAGKTRFLTVIHGHKTLCLEKPSAL